MSSIKSQGGGGEYHLFSSDESTSQAKTSVKKNKSSNIVLSKKEFTYLKNSIPEGRCGQAYNKTIGFIPVAFRWVRKVVNAILTPLSYPYMRIKDHFALPARARMMGAESSDLAHKYDQLTTQTIAVACKSYNFQVANLPKIGVADPGLRMMPLPSANNLEDEKIDPRKIFNDILIESALNKATVDQGSPLNSQKCSAITSRIKAENKSDSLDDLIKKLKDQGITKIAVSVNVPGLFGRHWGSVFMDLEEGEISYLDSKGTFKENDDLISQKLGNLQEVLQEGSPSKQWESLGKDSVSQQIKSEIKGKSQYNSWDCGVFSMVLPQLKCKYISEDISKMSAGKLQNVVIKVRRAVREIQLEVYRKSAVSHDSK